MLAHWHIRRHADEAERATGGGVRRFNPSEADERTDRDPLVARAVIEAKRGSQEAVRFLYTRYADNIYSYALSIVHSEDEAEDVTQQVFLKLMANLYRYEPRDVPFAAWIVRMTRNLAIDRIRERRETPCEEVFGPGVTTDDDHDGVRSHEIHAALDTLPEDQRQVIVLRHWLGLSPGEIGARLGKTEASIHGLHHRGRQALQRELTSRGAVPAAA